MAQIELRRIEKRYGAVAVVQPMDLLIPDGELTVFVGPSGCGKSTTLRMIAGLEDVSSGQMLIGGRDVTRLEPKDRNIAMVFQNYALYPHKTVFENLAFGLRLRNLDKAQIDRRVKWAAEMLGMEALLERKPRQLSGGQMQRVALGRALVREPDVFLLDEPLSNLDAKLRLRMRDEIARLHRELKTNMIYVTHDQVEAMTLGDRIVVMKDGRIQQVGTPLEVYDRPVNRFVAGFIGAPEMNLVDARIDGGSVVANGLRLPVNSSIRDGTAVTLGVRPEHITLGEAAHSLPMRAVQIEQMGAYTLAAFEHEGLRLRAMLGRDQQVVFGETRHLQLDLQQLHLFDHATGACLSRTNPDGASDV
ncbi:ABC transporter ATP-binding protein [Roseateles toxinivorans]|uniref:Carbohydrate ABC transporter ATP-binding protein (CUT1 family) n=1 Tax=Roseateles toxinivorans TaxID=270368 RepID=A0A4R6QTS8_9BURK|nr:sn-glycerol-3-phosphate ABC transporter ATP-binding protein UgpC [Roseateles toxinivorans]TDP74503.1 carbohydrate ABC transporter ATP-binding protein (CUT1 family) [Roseateles toxinivorans]